MKSRIVKNRIVGFAVLLLLLGVVAVASARSNRPVDNALAARAAIGPLAQWADANVLTAEDPRGLLDGVAGAEILLPAGLQSSDGPLGVMIELDGLPTARIYADAQARGADAVAAAQAQLAANTAAQAAFLGAGRSAGVDLTVLYQLQRTLNGVAAYVAPADIATLAALPGVARISALPIHTVENATGVGLIGAPILWAASGLDLTGEGISIAVIDTGIDYHHTTFGGPGGGYDLNDTTVITDGLDAYFGPGAVKVVGGYDFAGDDYNASGSGAALIPQPDPDPLDCNGHGTHVAGTAAGFGVIKDGTPYPGPWDETTDMSYTTFNIGPGVAPQADLYALRVFGCAGSTNVTAAAIEWAVDPDGDGDFSDRLDVINMSLGSGMGSPYDSSAVASDNAVLAGVIVVASAGNSGDGSHYITGSPGAARRVLSVAGVVDSGAVMDGFEVVAADNAALISLHPGLESVNYPWTDPGAPVNQTIPVTATLVYPVSQPTGCAAYDAANQALISGNIVLQDWDTPSCGGSVTRAANAVAAGAIGILMADDSDVFDLFIAGSAVVPALSIPRNVGDALRSELTAGNAVTVKLSHEYAGLGVVIDPSVEDTVYTSSSRGPARPADGIADALKPEVAAPAVSVYSAAALTGNSGASFNGTSMAAPHMAGAMALLRELHPDWTVEELKALAINTAVNDVYTGLNKTGDKYPPQRVGAGRADLPFASTSHVVAYNGDDVGYVGVSFGHNDVLVNTTAEATKQIVVSNKGQTTAYYNVSFVQYSDMPGVAFTVSPASVEIAAGASAMVTVTMNADAAAMLHTISDPTLQMSTGGLTRHWISEESGHVALTPAMPPAQRDMHQALRVPVYASARPVAAMSAGPEILDFSTAVTATITLSGQELDTGGAEPSYPFDVTSLVSFFELQGISPQLATRSGPTAADLQYVGAIGDLRGQEDIADAQVFFGLATYGEWASLSFLDVEFDIYIDTNRDGTADYVLYNSPYPGSPAYGDAFLSVLVNLSTNTARLQDYINWIPANAQDTYAHNNNVMFMPLNVADIGLTLDDHDFDYQVRTFQREVEGTVDIAGPFTYSMIPGLDFAPAGEGGARLVDDLDGAQVPVFYNAERVLMHDTLGVLALHHHNEGARAEVLRIQIADPTDVTLAAAGGNVLAQGWLLPAMLLVVVGLAALLVVYRRRSLVA